MALKDLLRTKIRNSGWMIRRFPTGLDQCLSRAVLLEQLKIDVVLDVGANVGHYGEELRQRGFKGKIVSFEPVLASFGQLQARAASDGRWEAKHLALGAAAGETKINVANTLSSILPKHAASDEGMKFTFERTETIQVRTLDDIWSSIVEPGQRVFLKLDVQGFEMHVLDGATQSLPTLQGVEVELSLTPMYDGQPSFDQMYERLKSAGFAMRQVWSHGINQNGRMADFDAIFERVGS